MAVTQKLTRREKRLWAGPMSMTGPGLREAIRLPTAVRTAVAVVGGLAMAAVLISADDRGWPEGSGVFGAVAVLWLSFLGLTFYARSRRRRLGLVQVTQPQFDLIMALSHVAPTHITEARRLHDDLVAAIADPQNRDADVTVIEARMRQLVAVRTDA